jgi:hypothetical protein
LRPHRVQRTERRSKSLDASGPPRIISGAKAIGARCRQCSHSAALTRTKVFDELGIVIRFDGKPVRSESPGLHFRQPYPIEEVRLPKVTRQNIIEVGMRSSEGSRGVLRVPEESLMLTGDENIVASILWWFWRIKDATKYLFNIQKPEVAVTEVAESAMRDIVGQSTAPCARAASPARPGAT